MVGGDRQTKSKPERRAEGEKNERKKDVNGPRPHLKRKKKEKKRKKRAKK